MAILSLGVDVDSLRVQRSLNDSSSTLAKSFERLSTGLRINSASDDAAGLAIADSLRVKARLYSGSIRNINDGISALNIIDGTLSAQSALTTRLIEIAEQSANGTFSEAQRRALNTEYQALVQESGRLGDTTSFNNLNLLLGGHGSSNPAQFNIQVGTSGGVTSNLQITTADTGTFSGVLNVNDIGGTAGAGSAYTIDELMAGTNNTAVLTRVTDSLGNAHEIYLAFADIGGAFRVNAFMRASESNGATSSDASKWVQMTSGTGVCNYNTSGQATSNLNMVVAGFSGGTLATVNLDISGLVVAGSATATNSPETGSSTALNLTGVETSGRGRVALDIATRRLSQISKLRGQFGAAQSRLETARGITEISRESTNSAESIIRDVDVASETASLIAAQILQQTGAKILSQASSRAEIILGLLRADK